MLKRMQHSFQSADGTQKFKKKFCTSLLIYSGPLAYEFMQQNLPQALPCLQTVQQVIHSEYKTVSEGDFKSDDLLICYNI